MDRVKLFTHTDLDGIGCGVVANLVFDHVDIEYCLPSNINRKVQYFIERKEYKNYHKIFITDISVDVDTAEKINDTMKRKCILLDHHKTAEELNQYSWAKVTVESEIGLECGTHLLKSYLEEQGLYHGECDDFIENVRRYDTWEWHNRYQDKKPKQLNDLFKIYGRDKFIKHLLHMLAQESIITFDKQDQLLLELREEQFERYVQKKDRDIIIRNIEGYTVGISFAEQFISELGNVLAENHPECDYIAMINPATGVSYRSVKEEIDLGKIAQRRGGGGHAKAAGSRISQEQREEIIDSIFHNQDEQIREKSILLRKVQWFSFLNKDTNGKLRK